MHLAVGGFTMNDESSFDPCPFVSGADGDMGENNTAGFDPIFFFHHCWIDRLFWKWQ
jgi:tyrosinase